jgi:hypothetical protein
MTEVSGLEREREEEEKMSAKWHCALIVLALLLAAPHVWAVPFTAQVDYEATSLGGTQWRYTYTVTNGSLPAPIREFTIWFDQSLFRNLQVATPNPPSAGWNELVVQPDWVLEDDGFYDALTLGGGILAGEQVAGFAVQFEWLGTGQPGSQVFQVADPATFETVYQGLTVPEPGMTVFLGLAITVASIHRKGHPRADTRS